ncbi:MAG: hypothetical protein IH614_04735 [Desulfuromonadales bacterium]|nr:hypothetical protein [Desulfuromonadales bacterium]
MRRLVGNAAILGLVLLGIGLFGFFGISGTEKGAASSLFLCFFALIITTMAVPALVLFVFFLKEIGKMIWGKGKEVDSD